MSCGVALERTVSDQVLAVLRRVRPHQSVPGRDIERIVASLSGDRIQYTHTGSASLFDLGRAQSIILASQSIPFRSRFHRVASYVVQFDIHTTGDPVAVLALFLVWFKRVYCADLPSNREGVVRIGYILVDHGVIGVLLCDASVDVFMDISGNGMVNLTNVVNTSRLFVIWSSDANMSQGDVERSVRQMRRLLRPLGLDTHGAPDVSRA
ncbi:hypothetical protein CONPUDRAFT_167429 [Coniophora puteana RWD-64-598 SS2]|uniref:Uncharacterized protein n=1 Tax=Coniophora puteana (strain RWD-64-598) TaxID=741705 RepID=A0A5M3MH28_CONPW|nr:uncharacterized protein CONPUDRAFT_167429 [Coniophora puteana RWD-64-598 SS2]EIW78413.1 hypothetical protein CONPUDRAFT_167429 [Coniophora puteana RWD-64-598 SS2]